MSKGRRAIASVLIDPSASIHPTALIEEGVKIGEGSSVWDNVHIRRNSRIGGNCIIGEKTYIAYDVKIGHDVKINSFVYICTAVIIEEQVMISAGTVFTNDRFPRAFEPDGTTKTSDPTEETLGTLVRRGVTIGAGCTIGPGIELGEYAMIGMGSVVTRSVMPYQLVFGNPARPKGFVCYCGEPVVKTEKPAMNLNREVRCQKCNRRYVSAAQGLRPCDAGAGQKA